MPACACAGPRGHDGSTSPVMRPAPSVNLTSYRVTLFILQLISLSQDPLHRRLDIPLM